MTNRTYVKLAVVFFDYTDLEGNRKARTYFPNWTLTEEFENEIDERKVMNMLKDKLFRVAIQDLMSMGKYKDIDVTCLHWKTITIKIKNQYGNEERGKCPFLLLNCAAILLTYHS